MRTQFSLRIAHLSPVLFPKKERQIRSPFLLCWYKLFSPRIASHNATRGTVRLSFFSSNMENHSSRRQLFGKPLQATGIDPLKEVTELAIGNIERWLYNDDPNSICDVPKNNLTGEEESKRLLSDDIDNWLRESSIASHLDPLAQVQAKLPSPRKTEMPQYWSRQITSLTIPR